MPIRLVLLITLAMTTWAGCAPSNVAATVAGTNAKDEAASSDTETAEAAPVTPAGPKPGETPDQPIEITWDDLNLPLPPDSTYESWMLTTRAKSVLDKYVRITGHMYGGLLQKDNVRTFPLMRDKDCPFGAGGHAHHVVEVNLQGKLRTRYTASPVTVEGFLSVAPFTGTDGTTWSVYHLEGTKIQ